MKISHYRVVARIGAGGMGEVYRAVDERIGREVALKLLPLGKERVADRQLRLLREAQAAGALNHPGIVTVYDVGAHDGRPFLVMELVDGQRFSDLAGHVEPGEALRLCAAAAEALAAAHQRGILHRDVKSDNLMRLPDGRVKVLDFGLAKLRDGSASSSSADSRSFEDTAPAGAVDSAVDAAVDVTIPADAARPVLADPAPDLGSSSSRSDVNLTRAGAILGTPAYMSPEQAHGKPATARSEVFSLGVVLYELLVGRRPFVGDTADETLQLVRAAALVPSSQAAGRPALRAVDPVVAAALAADPARRPADMRAFAEELRRVAAVLERGPRRRRLALAAVLAAALTGGVVAVAVVTGGGAPPAAAPPATVDAGRPKGPPVLRTTNVHRLTAADGCEEFPSFMADGKSVVYDGAAGANYHIFSVDVSSHEVRELTRVSGWDYAAAVSPDGTRMAFIRSAEERAGVYLAPLTPGATPRRLLTGSVKPTWTPDGRFVWAGHHTAPSRIDVETGAASRTLAAPPGTHLPLLLELRDGGVVAVAWPSTMDLPRGLGLLYYPPGSADPRWIFRGFVDEAVAAAPDGRAVLVASRRTGGTIELWYVPLDGGEPTSLGVSDIAPGKGMVLSPDGKHVSWSTCDVSYVLSALVDGGAGASLQRVVGGTWYDAQPAWDPVGDRLVVVSDRGGDLALWVIGRRPGVPARALPKVPGEPGQPAVSRDGTLIAFTERGKGIRLLPVDGSAPARALSSGAGDAAPTFSRDGARIFYQSGDGAAPKIVAVPTAGGPTEEIAEGAEPAASPAADLLAFVAGGVPQLIELSTGRRRLLSKTLTPGAYTTLRFSADGKRLAALRGMRELVEVEVATGRVLRQYDAGGDQLTGLAYAGTDLLVAVVVWQGDLWFADIAIE